MRDVTPWPALVIGLAACGSGSGSGDKDSASPDTDTDSAVPAGTVDVDLDSGCYAKVTGLTEHAGAIDATALDVDGDGGPNLVVGLSTSDANGYLSGATYVFGGDLPPGHASVSTASGVVLGAAGETAGEVENAGDVDVDGTEDLLIGALGYDSGLHLYEGRAYLFHGPIVGTHATAEASTIFQGAGVGGDYPGSYVGYPLARAGDTDGDGVSEFLIGAQGEAAIYLERSDRTGLVVLGDHDEARYLSDWLSPWTAGPLGDIDGDGLDDVVLNGLIFTGPLAPELTDADADIFVETPYETWADPAGDLNGDGYDDVLAPDDIGSHIVLGPLTGTVDADANGIAYVTSGGTGGGFNCRAAVGDVDGDGAYDLACGQAGASNAAPGAAWIAFGPFAGEMSVLDGPSVRLLGNDEDEAGYDVIALGDMTGDSLPDVGITGPGDSDGAIDAGAVWVVDGTVRGP